MAGAGRVEETARRLTAEWTRLVDAATAAGPDVPATEAQVIGAVNRAAGPRDVVVCAAGGLPGELHRLWRTGTRAATTSSTATPAWDTRSPAGSA